MQQRTRSVRLRLLNQARNRLCDVSGRNGKVQVDPGDEAQEARQLIQRCVTGDYDAIQSFQAQFGELVYGYPVKAYQVAAEEAGDFYVYAFDRGRIFRRCRTYEGRAPFQAYLVAIVLDHLMIDWKRSERSIETVPLDTMDVAAEADGGLREVEITAGQVTLQTVIRGLEPRKAIIMKLLHVEDCELNAAELSHLQSMSGRATRDLVVAVDNLRESVRSREAAAKRIEDSLDAVHAWISLYERRLRRVADDLRALPQNASSAERLRVEKQALEGKLQRRHHQRDKLLGERRRRKVTAPYKEIAAILNTSVGNVASMIARTRNEIAQRLRPEEKEPTHGLSTAP